MNPLTKAQSPPEGAQSGIWETSKKGNCNSDSGEGLLTEPGRDSAIPVI